MSRRLKVLISAYACEPNKGSEPEVGWQWSLQMARFHDVTVLTRENNRAAIERELQVLREWQPVPSFVYHDETPHLLDIKKRFSALKMYYILWQRSAHEVVGRLHQETAFDLFHHVTFAAFRYPSAIWGHGVPCVWGPVGGIESIPLRLLPWSHPRSLLKELARDIHNLIQAAPFHILPKRAGATTVTLASTPEMQRAFGRLGFEARLMPTIGLNTKTLPYRAPTENGGPLRLLFVGNIITLKGVDLALHALKESQTSATFTLVGDGDYLPAARSLVKKLGLEKQVEFRGRMSREEVLRLYPNFDVFMFPSLHDTGGYAVIEAMFNELPVVCLDCGGPAVAVREGCGVRVPVSGRGGVISGLARAIRDYDQSPAKRREHGKKAREIILQDYDWDKKGAQMDEVYQQALTLMNSDTRKKTYSGLGGTTHALHKVISFKGVMLALLALLLVGGWGFLSVSELKHEARQIVDDTLPSLSFAGQANAYIVDASRTLLYITTDDPAERTKVRNEIDELSLRTTHYLDEYSQAIFTSEDRTNFDNLVEMRKEYIRIRENVLDLATAGKRQEALARYRDSLLPMHSKVKAASDKLFAYNMEEGRERGKKIMSICTVTQVVLAVTSVLIFLMGFFIGFFK
jgi:glycosyltransferase involved in cell wall biosynthesis